MKNDELSPEEAPSCEWEEVVHLARQGSERRGDGVVEVTVNLHVETTLDIYAAFIPEIKVASPPSREI